MDTHEFLRIMDSLVTPKTLIPAQRMPSVAEALEMYAHYDFKSCASRYKREFLQTTIHPEELD